VGTIFAVIGFAVAALVINWVGDAVFKAAVTFKELVRAPGLAYILSAPPQLCPNQGVEFNLTADSRSRS
jgi:hypothetical protein